MIIFSGQARLGKVLNALTLDNLEVANPFYIP